MRKLFLLIATLSLGTFALAQTMNSGELQAAGNDWYNQHLSSQVQQFDRIAAAIAPSATAQAEEQGGALPESMAGNVGAGNDWYNQRLTAQVQDFERIKAACAPAAASSGQ